MEAQTQLRLYHQIQIITTRCCLNLPARHTKPSASTFSWPTRSFQNGISLTGLSEAVAPVESSKRALESGLVTEEGTEEDWEMEAEEWIELVFNEEGRYEKLCGEKKGIAEVMECLEDDAILGSDQGRDPTDYNRRAHIFDKSSRVFQSLKQRNSLR